MLGNTSKLLTLRMLKYGTTQREHSRTQDSCFSWQTNSNCCLQGKFKNNFFLPFTRKSSLRTCYCILLPAFIYFSVCPSFWLKIVFLFGQYICIFDWVFILCLSFIEKKSNIGLNGHLLKLSKTPNLSGRPASSCDGKQVWIHWPGQAPQRLDN